MTATDDTRSLTYAELGKLRGISPASAKRLALRHGWHKEPGNDGLARVRVPATWLETPPATEVVHHPGDTSPATVPVATLARVQQDAEAAIRAAEGRADQEAQAAAELRVQLAHREGELAGLREAMHRADAAAEVANQRAEAAVERLRQSEERAERAQAAAREAWERAERLRQEHETRMAQLREAAETAQRGRQTAEAALGEWTAGGPLRRALRALRTRPGRP